MKFSIAKSEDSTSLKIGVEKLDSKVAPELKSQFILLANDETSGNLLVDLSLVAFADSSGLSALLLAHRLYRDTTRRLVFIGAQERILRLIEISQLTSVFTIAPNESAALELIKTI